MKTAFAADGCEGFHFEFTMFATQTESDCWPLLTCDGRPAIGARDWKTEPNFGSPSVN